MNAYEQLVKTMQNQSNKNKPSEIQIGIMKNDEVVTIKEQQLDRSDYYISHDVDGKLEKGDKVAVTYCESSNCYIVLAKVV